jgi:hypothetical protein
MAASAGFLMPETVALRREAIVMALALLVIAAAIPAAILDTIQTGRVYLFSRQFLEELPQRFTGPGRLRFIFQPVLAILLGVRGASLTPGRETRPSCPACCSIPGAVGHCCEAERRPSAPSSPWGSSWTSCSSWSFTMRCIQVRPWWSGRFSFASPTGCPGH